MLCYGFAMVSLCCCYGFAMVLLWFSCWTICFLRVFEWLLRVLLRGIHSNGWLPSTPRASQGPERRVGLVHLAEGGRNDTVAEWHNSRMTQWHNRSNRQSNKQLNSNLIGNSIGNTITKWHSCKWHFELNMEWNKWIKGFPGLLNTLETSRDRAWTILHFFQILKNARIRVHVCGDFWVQSLRLLGACSRKRLGACMRLLGACMRKLLGAKYLETFGCKVYAFWVHVWYGW